MRRLAALLLPPLLCAGCLFDHSFFLFGATIAPGFSVESPITDGCRPQRDNFCGWDESVRIERVTVDDPSVVSAEIAGTGLIRVTALQLGSTTVHVDFVDNHGDDRSESAVYRVATGDRVIFAPRCDLAFDRQGSAPWPLPGGRGIEFVAYTTDQGEWVQGDGYSPWDVGSMNYLRDTGYGSNRIYLTPALTTTHVVTSPIDPALDVPLAFVAPADLTLGLQHLGNERTGDTVRLDFAALVSAAGAPLCVDPFFRKLTVETPDTCRFSPDPVQERTSYSHFHAFATAATGTCGIRVELEGTPISGVIEASVELTP